MAPRRHNGPEWTFLITLIPVTVASFARLAEFHVWQAAPAVALFLGVFRLHGIVGPSPLWAIGA
jgi:hypothetical protein